MGIANYQLFFDEREVEAARQALESGVIGGGGPWLERAEAMLRERLGCRHALAVTSGTHALETAMMVHAIGQGDEVIVPAFTFPSTASCAVRQGATVVFADIREDDLNIDPEEVARKVTGRTRAIVAMHYGGIPCDMDALSGLAREKGLVLFEDAAHAFDSRYRGKACGTLADAGCLSFHVSKSVTCGEGGAFLTDSDEKAERAEVLREMGTDRARFRRGEVAGYVWRDLGSSFIPSDVLMAVLAVQLEKADEILRLRRRLFDRYLAGLAPHAAEGRVKVPSVPAHAQVNGHIFFILLADGAARERCQSRLEALGIQTLRHYFPLDRTPFGSRYAADDDCPRARSVSERLLRLPLHPRLTASEQDAVIEAVGKSAE